jgi:hypothetical protein
MLAGLAANVHLGEQEANLSIDTTELKLAPTMATEH